MRSKITRGAFKVACCFALIACACIFGLYKTFADSAPFMIDGVEITQKSDTTSGDVSGIDGNRINNDITFRKVGDSVTYKIKIKNIGGSDRVIDDVASDYRGELFAYEFNSYAGDTVAAGESFDFVLKTTYTNAVSDVTKRNQELEIKFVFKFSDGSEMTIVIANPSTWDNISVFGAIFAACIIGLLAFVIFRMKRIESSKKVVMTGVLLAIACLPLPFVNAIDGSYDVSIRNNITLNDELVVRFVAEDEEVASEIVGYDDLAEAPTAPEKEGYHFDGWTTEDGELFDFSAPISDDVELYAAYSANDYTVTFNGNGATSGGMAAQTFTYDEAKNLSTNRFAKIEHDFVGWNTKADGTGDSFADGAEVTNLIPEGTITLYAQWTPNVYAIIFNANGGTGEMSAQKLKKGESQKLAKNVFKKDDYAFWYWNTKADGTGTRYNDEQAVKDLAPLGQTIELFAIYSRERYEHLGDIVFDGTNYVDTGVYLFNDRNIDRDFVVTFEIKDFTVAGELATLMNSLDERDQKYAGMVFRFNGGNQLSFVANNSATQKTEKPYGTNSGQKVTIKRIGKTLYFALNDEVDAEFYNFTELSGSFDYPVTFGASLDGNKQPWRYFTGTLSNLKVELLDEEDKMGKIKFDANGGTGTMAYQSILEGQTAKIKSNAFSHVSYRFVEWNTKADGTGERYSDEEVVSNLVSAGEEITLYAQWAIYDYKVVFHANGGTGSMAAQTFTNAVAQALNENAFTKSGYSFAFWNTKADGSGQSYQDKEIVSNLASVNGTVDLYAIYEKDSYKHNGDISFDGNNYVNTEMFLFSKKNIHRDFELSFEIKNIANNRKQDTIVSAIDETGGPWPGFVFRVASNNANQLEMAANSTRGNEVELKYDRDSAKKVFIRRVNDVLYIKINDGAEERVIDYSNISKEFYAPLVIGASLNGSFKPQRQITGTLSNISVRFLN